MKQEFDCGSIEYRLPDISEAMILMGKLGVSFEQVEEKTEENKDLIFVGKLIRELGPLIVKIDIKIGEKKLSSYDECLREFRLINGLSEMATKVISCMEVSPEKKP